MFAPVDRLFLDDLADRSRTPHQRATDDQQYQQLARLGRYLLDRFGQGEAGVAGDGVGEQAQEQG
ncbi:hypothetical protein A5645_12240 [Mycobacterium asiaticum]|nr:hypothetical protein A5645_12240 [Mycobacterium asiaticum]